MGEHNDGRRVFDSLRDALDGAPEFAKSNAAISINHSEDDGEYNDYLFSFLSDLRDYTILVDEADRYCSPVSVPLGLRRIVNYQRHYRLNLIFVSRRPAAVHRDVSALSDVVHIFHVHEPRDLDYLAALCGSEFSGRLPALRPFEYLTKNLS